MDIDNRPFGYVIMIVMIVIVIAPPHPAAIHYQQPPGFMSFTRHIARYHNMLLRFRM
jgi:hypothetical protein